MVFWVLATLFALVAAAFVAVPLLYTGGAHAVQSDSQRDENLRLFAERQRELAAELEAGGLGADEHAALLLELQQSLLDDVSAGEAGAVPTASRGSRPWLLALLIAAAVPVVALTLYSRWGFIDDVELMDLFRQSLAAQGDADRASALVVELGKVVKDDAERPWAWYFLGENFASLGMFNEAQIAYLQAAERLVGEPEESLVLGRAALALYIKSEFAFTAELEELIARARAINPNEIAIIQLLAADAQNRGDYAEAIANWRLLIQSDPNSLEAQSLRAEIANAQRLLREQEGGAEAGDEIGTGPVLDVQIAAAEGLALEPGWRVFVAVRNAEREGMPPLAARDLLVSDLPLTVSLDSSSAVGPFDLSAADLVRVSVLVSRSGTATPMPGDYRVVSDDFAHNGQHAVISLTLTERVE